MENLSEFERLSLYNQYTILNNIAELKGDEEAQEYYHRMAEIFRNGYSVEYDRQDNVLDSFKFDDKKITITEQNEVSQVLSMYSYLSDHYNSAKKVYQNLPELKYVGFDDNDEVGGRQNNYLNFILNDKKVFKNVKIGFQQSEDNTNSHGYNAPRVSMLKKYLELNENEDFYDDTSKYVKEILEAK